MNSLFQFSPTLEDRFLAAGQRSSGFDYMRLCLALCILLWHTVEINYGAHARDMVWQGAGRIFLGPLVPMFFALSGFLVAGSLARNTLIKFIGLRVFRIAPALVCEVVLCALILGPVVTYLPLKDYFTDRGFFAYFLNIFGDIHYTLPGVFANNSNTNTVNGQLWTIPYELASYIALTLMAALGIFRRRILLLVCVGSFYFFQMFFAVFAPHADVAGVISGTNLVMVFITGVTFFRYRDKIPYNFFLFVLSLLASSGLYAIDGGEKFVPIFTAYATIYLGLLNPPRHKIILSGDYSYGIYIYAYPIQQMVAYCMPHHRFWYYSVPFSLPLTIAAAALSWGLVEKPVLNRRAILNKWESDLTGFFRRSKNPASYRAAE